MQIDIHDWLWLDRSQSVSVSELVEVSGLSADDVNELVELGALVPLDCAGAPLAFGADCVFTVRQASRLRDELELDSHALALTLSLLEQIRSLESELRRLRARQPAYRRF